MEAFPTYTLTLQRQINPWLDKVFAERYVEALHRYFDFRLERARRFAWNMSTPEPATPIRYVLFGGEVIHDFAFAASPFATASRAACFKPSGRVACSSFPRSAGTRLRRSSSCCRSR